MATIRPRDSGFWQAIVRRRGRPQESKTFAKKSDAEAWARKIESEIDRGVYQSAADAERMTLGEMITRFEVEYAPHHYRLRSDEKEAWRYQCQRLREALGDYSLASIDQRRVAAYRDGRLTGTADRPAVSASTVRKELYLLSRIMGFAERECGITLPRGNPVAKIRKPADGKARERRLTDEEWQRLVGECKASRSPYLWPAVQMAVETAMRQGELLGLRWEHVNLDRKIAMLAETKNGDARAVPLSSAAMAVLRTLPRSITGQVLPAERLTIYHAFKAAMLRAGISDFTFHDLRHESLSRLAERGDFSVLEMAAISGHKTLAMLKRYTHLQAEKLAAKLG